MLMPQDQIRSLSGLTEDIYKSLENIGIKYMLQLVTMTRAQVLCIKGICDAELSMILKSLIMEGMDLALKPLEFVVEPMGQIVLHPAAGKYQCAHSVDRQRAQIMIPPPIRG